MTDRSGWKQPQLEAYTKRRRALFDTMRESQRLDRIRQSRELVQKAVEEDQAKERRRRRNVYYAQQMMQPQWMVQRPRDLETAWIAVPRPEGKRCLVFAYKGQTVSRARNGQVLHRFQSHLPNGSISMIGSSYTILDCVFQKARKTEMDTDRPHTYIVMDVLCWNGYHVQDKEPSFRFFFARQKINEVLLVHDTVSAKYAFDLCYPAQPATPEGIRLCYTRSEENALLTFQYRQDGILFYHSQSTYEGQVSPYVQMWKDPWCCPYFIDTDGHTPVQHKQQTTNLVIEQDHGLYTWDCVLLGYLSDDVISTHAPQDMVRVAFEGVEWVQGNPRLVRPSILARSSRGKCFADTWSKVLFQSMARKQQTLTLEQLCTPEMG